MSSKVDKWVSWLDVIKHQLYAVMWSRKIYRETMEIITSNQDLPQKSAFYPALQTWYVDHVLMAVRRQVKVSNQSVSLARLLVDIGTTPALLSRKRWRRLFEGSVISHLADRHYDELVGRGKSQPDAVVIEADLTTLQVAATTCETFSDKRVAHYDRGIAPKSPTWDEINGALDTLDHLFRKYYLLVTADNVVTTTPDIAYNWKKIFRQAWLPPTV